MKLPLTLNIIKMIILTQILPTIIDQTTKITYTPHMVDNQANVNNIYIKRRHQKQNLNYLLIFFCLFLVELLIQISEARLKCKTKSSQKKFS